MTTTSGAACRAIEGCPELNMSNYDEVGVERLNDWAIRANDEIDRLHALAAGQAAAAQPDDMGHKSIDMVLHCPKCGLQHIDKDNSEDLLIEAAELGVDREGDRELERWIEEREWTNPPHRSHLCASCKHIWRPADVCTNGVLAVKTKGQEDSHIEEVATRIYGGGRGGGKANKELLQLINEVHRENID